MRVVHFQESIFQHLLLRPTEFDVLAAPNLNGDYLSDAVAAQVGGVGIALFVIFGLTSIDRPWGFLLGFILGLASGLGTALVIAGLLEMRKGRS